MKTANHSTTKSSITALTTGPQPHASNNASQYSLIATVTTVLYDLNAKMNDVGLHRLLQ